VKTKGNESEGPRFSEQSGAFRATCLVLKGLNNSLPSCARRAGARQRTQESPGTCCQSIEEMEQNKVEVFDNEVIEM